MKRLKKILQALTFHGMPKNYDLKINMNDNITVEETIKIPRANIFLKN